jgi:gas vesicle protein
MKTGKALLAVLTGMAAGVALGLIFSPENGDRSQKKMSRKGGELADVLADEKFGELEARIAAEHQRQEQDL